MERKKPTVNLGRVDMHEEEGVAAGGWCWGLEADAAGGQGSDAAIRRWRGDPPRHQSTR